MRKTAAQIEKELLLAKMARERQELAQVIPPAPADTHAGREKPPFMERWSTTSLLVSAAALGRPRFLRKPLRALAAVAIRNRIKAFAQGHGVRSGGQQLADDDRTRLVQLMAKLRAAAERETDPAELERLRLQLDGQVRALRMARTRTHTDAAIETPLSGQGHAG